MGHIKRSLFLIFVFLFNVSCAEDTCKQLVNSFLNADSIVMQLDITRCINNGDVFGAKVTAIKVSKNNQVIMDNNDPKFASDEGWRTMYFEDLNHDGFADIVLVSLPYSASVDYSFLLFDKETQTRVGVLDLGLTGLTVVNEGLPFFNPSAILAGDAHANPGNVPREELTATP